MSGADQDALHWLIALQEAPDDAALQSRFDAWHRAGAENRRAWADAQRVWDVLGDARPVPVVRTGWRVAAASVLGAAAVCAGLWFAPAVGLWWAADYSTATAQTLDIRLDDGSTVHLGADSAIEVSFAGSARDVRLLSGEAFFEVSPDPARPFRVVAGDVTTTVLGTAFDVGLTSGGVTIAVDHGRVAVSGKHVATDLGAGDWVRVAHDGGTERGNDAPELAGGWRTGMLVVKDRPVADVVDELRRHYGGTIILAGGNIGEQRVTGVYDLRSPVDALRAVAMAHDANVRQITPWVTVVSSF